MPTTRKQIEELIARLEPTLRRAFQQAIDDWRRNVDLDALAAALRRGDIEAGIRAANIQPAALNGFLTAREAAFEAAGAAELSSLRLNIIFNARHLRGEQQLSRYGAQFVQAVSDDTKAMLRTSLTDSLSRGQGAKAAARGIRDMIGLTDSQAGWAINLRHKLENDPKGLLSEFAAGGYKLRDKRLDGIVRRAVKAEKPIAAGDIEKIVTAYQNRAIRWRSENIARTETLRAVQAGNFEAYQQAVEGGKITAQNVRKVWNSAHDKRVRHTHRELDGESVGLNELFVSPSGASLRYPLDPNAPLEETVNCRCNLTYRIDHLANIR
ncbi:phage minor head protein [Afipia carboxidovorans]|uniref:phage minor head protein n=1 Tax=Afipia carboxidovorans TaxID=40137 RepID=UPI00308B8BCE|nr:phage minor head protein [Afipia carboxidovorans]